MIISVDFGSDLDLNFEFLSSEWMFIALDSTRLFICAIILLFRPSKLLMIILIVKMVKWIFDKNGLVSK